MLIKDAIYVYRLVGGDKLTWHGRYHTHDQRDYEFHLFTEGQGAFLLNRSRYRIEGNSLFLTRPREFHSILPEAVEKPISYYAILFEPDPSDLSDGEALALINSAGQGGNRGMPIEARDRFLMEELYHLKRSGTPQNGRASEYLILSLIYRWYGHSLVREDQAEERMGRNEHVERALALMEKQVRKKLGTGDMAEVLGVSDEHFIRLFRKALGMTPFQYFTRLKIEGASAVLVDTRLGVGEVAEHFGFENPFHFSRVFRKCTGLSPSRYRSVYSRRA